MDRKTTMTMMRSRSSRTLTAKVLKTEKSNSYLKASLSRQTVSKQTTPIIKSMLNAKTKMKMKMKTHSINCQ